MICPYVCHFRKRKEDTFMQVGGNYTSATQALFSPAQTSQNVGASQSSSSDASSAVQWFMAYAKESPGQQMFTNWLGSQNISQAQYNAMSPQQQEKLRTEFEQHLKTQMDPSGSTASISVQAKAFS
jgi:hypothetical protein